MGVLSEKRAVATTSRTRSSYDSSPIVAGVRPRQAEAVALAFALRAYTLLTGWDGAVAKNPAF